jgi:hypothetical protein
MTGATPSRRATMGGAPFQVGVRGHMDWIFDVVLSV